LPLIALITQMVELKIALRIHKLIEIRHELYCC